MDAIVCHDYGDATVETVACPTPAADEVLIEVDRVQLSVTECQSFTGRSRSDTLEEKMYSGHGRLFGHEFCGSVVEVGKLVADLEIGDRVYCPGKITCDDCPLCRAGYLRFCRDKELLGRDRPGALAEYVTLPPAPLTRLPDSISDLEGAAMQPLASSLGYVSQAPIDTGDVVAVLGTGVMGYQCGQAALLEGAGSVIAVDRNPGKLELASDRGMLRINVTETDPVEQVHEYTGSVGADVVFEAIGGQQTDATSGNDPLAQAFSMVRPGGTVVEVGTIIGEVTISPRPLAEQHVTLMNLLGDPIDTGPNSDTGRLAPELVADGRVSIAEYVTHEFSGLDSFDQAVEITLNKKEYDALGPPQLVLG
jgi:threonine dehydrogenase-like Zn-dependent dehydrogenase